MQRIATIGIIVLAGLFAFPAVARADHRGPRWGFNFGFGWHGGQVGVGFGGCRPVHRPRHVHVHTRVPCYEKVWVPPVYERVVTGYKRCGTPIYRTVQIRCGYYRSVVVGHRCGDCGVSCN